MARTKRLSDEALVALARRAGVAEGVLFQRFPTKAELFFSAIISPPSFARPCPYLPS